MKRRIDASQLKELTDEQQTKLRELWKPQCGDLILFYDPALRRYSNESIVYAYDPYNGRVRDVKERVLEKRECLPLLSVSQMIELLQEKYPVMGIERRLGIEYGWNIEHYRAFELADVLWIMVKEVLAND